VRRKPLDDDEIIRTIAKYYGFSYEDAASARERLSFRREDFRIRFSDLVIFAHDFGLPIDRLAEFVAANTSGIEPFVAPIGPVQSAWEALVEGDNAAAEARANEMLESAPTRPYDWDTGNWIHHAHLVLGHVRLRAGDIQGAEEHLLAAGRTPGSPQLNSFGPNMTLAKALLERGRRRVVLDFFRECATFWMSRGDRLAEWHEAVSAGRIPDFGPNLAYGGSRELNNDGS
jgi:hypothetical protein